MESLSGDLSLCLLPTPWDVCGVLGWYLLGLSVAPFLGTVPTVLATLLTLSVKFWRVHSDKVQ